MRASLWSVLMAGLASGVGSAAKHKLDDDEDEHATDALLTDGSSKKVKHSTSSTSLHPPILHSLSSSSSSSSSPPPPSSPSPSANKAAFAAFVESLTPQTADILHVQIPLRILELHAYIQQLPPFYPAFTPPSLSTSAAPSSSSSSPSPSPSPGSPSSHPVHPITSPIPPHPLLTTLLPYLHSSLSQLVTHLSALKLHLQLLIPPIDDSPAFGVEIVEETIAELARHEDAAFTTLERIPAYANSRARVLSKVVKWPGVEDYHAAVGELDEGMWLDVRAGLVEVREAYTAVWDMWTKNEERLRDPTGEKYRHMAM